MARLVFALLLASPIQQQSMRKFFVVGLIDSTRRNIASSAPGLLKIARYEAVVPDAQTRREQLACSAEYRATACTPTQKTLWLLQASTRCSKFHVAYPVNIALPDFRASSERSSLNGIGVPA